MLDARLEPPAVAQYDAYPGRPGAREDGIQAGIAYRLDALEEAYDRGVAESGGREIGEGCRPAHQRQRHAERQAELQVHLGDRVTFGLDRLAHDGEPGRQHTDVDPLHVRGGDVVARAQGECGVDRSLHVATAGVRLDGGASELEAALGGDVACVRSVRVGVEEAEPSLEDGVRRAEARLGEGRRVQTGARRPTRVEALRPRAGGEELHRAGRLAARDPEGGGEPGTVEAEDHPGGHGRSEGAAGSRRMEAAAI